MKIVKSDIIILRATDHTGQTPVLVRIWTDEGIYGYGETGVSILNYSLGCVELLKSFLAHIIGEDPLATDVIYTKLINSFWAKGNGGVIMAAISAIDIALWDIKGKYFKVPVYELLGGKQRKKIRAYASQLQNGWKYENFLGSPGDIGFLRDACQQAVNEGYDCIKVDILAKDLKGRPISRDEAENHLSIKTMKEADKKLTAIREVVGDDIEIILENHCLTRANTAIQFGKLAENYNPSLFEEPANPMDILEYRRIRDSVSIPLATGERSYTRRGFKPLLEAGVLDVVQPDIGNCGGFTEGRKIADLADTYGATVQMHTCNSPISLAASLQIEAALPNFYIHEHHTNNTLPQIREQGLYDYQPVNGYFDIPELPGIGNELSEKALSEAQIITVG